MKLGVSTYIWSAGYDSAVEDVLPRLKEHGFDGIEFPIFDPKIISPSRVRRALEANDLECNVASVFIDHLSLISPDKSVRDQSVQRLKDVIAVAAECGAPLVAGPLYSRVGYLPGRRRTADEWSWAVEGYQQLSDSLEEHHVAVAIEPLNRFETYFLNTAADAVRLCDEISNPNIGILFDTFHANIEEKDVAAALLSLEKHLKVIHTSENDRGTPGSGHIAWGKVFEAILQMHYDGWLTIESFGFSIEGLNAAASIWRDIEESPSVIAFDGVRFLRSCVDGLPTRHAIQQSQLEQ